MLNIIYDTRGYFFALLVVSLFCWILERLAPWRLDQRALRHGIRQDLFWLVFNGHYAGVLVAFVAAWLFQGIGRLTGWSFFGTLESVRLLGNVPIWAQVVVFLVMKDLLEWCVHSLLHRIPVLWEFHKLHHSIVDMDWIGNMRFHWMEIVVYKSLTYLPLVLLGVDGHVILWVAIFSTLIGHLNHANLRISWGPIRYVLNSPRMHIWHHDVALRGRYGQNFAVIFSLWDWVFGTAYLPDEVEQPERLGFAGMERFPKGLIWRSLYPLWKGSRHAA